MERDELFGVDINSEFGRDYLSITNNGRQWTSLSITKTNALKIIEALSVYCDTVPAPIPPEKLRNFISVEPNPGFEYEAYKIRLAYGNQSFDLDLVTETKKDAEAWADIFGKFLEKGLSASSVQPEKLEAGKRYVMHVPVELYECDNRLWPDISYCIGHWGVQTLIEEGITFTEAE